MIKKILYLLVFTTIFFLNPFVIQEAFGAQSSVELIRYYNSSIKDYWSTTATQIPNPSNPPSGYVQEVSQGYILTEQPQSDYFFFNDCYWKDKKDHFNSGANGDPNGPDENCKDYPPRVLLGYVRGSERPGTKWVKRCYKNGDEHYTETGSTPCMSGFTSEGGLGWILDHAYAAPGPFSLTGTPQCSGSTSQIKLDWSPGATNVDPINDPTYSYYQVFRYLTSWSLIHTSRDLSFQYTDESGLIVGNTYSYLVRAVNIDNDSYSNLVSSVVPTCPQPTPTPTPQPPIIDLQVEWGLSRSQGPQTIPDNTLTSMYWTTTNSPDLCTASHLPVTTGVDWSGSVPTGASQNLFVGTLTGPSSITFSLNCSNTSGSDSDSVVVNISAPGAQPRIQTSGGDVHSNEDINVP